MTIYNSNYTHRNVQNYYNEKCTYNVIIDRNLLYALKIWNRSLDEAILEEYGVRNMANFTRALQSLKIGILMGSFNPKS